MRFVRTPYDSEVSEDLLRDPGHAQASLRETIGERSCQAQDVAIWSRKHYQPRPTFCRSDGEIGKYRRYCEQFYPDGQAYVSRDKQGAMLPVPKGAQG